MSMHKYRHLYKIETFFQTILILTILKIVSIFFKNVPLIWFHDLLMNCDPQSEKDVSKEDVQKPRE